jgi:hypothetical protein
MHINFPPNSAKAVGVPNPDNAPAKARDVAAIAPRSQTVAVSGSDARIIGAAEAALKACTETDSRINDIRQAVRAGLIRFDADALAASIIRYHGK